MCRSPRLNGGPTATATRGQRGWSTARVDRDRVRIAPVSAGNAGSWGYASPAAGGLPGSRFTCVERLHSERILTRYRCLRLSWTDTATGAPVRARRREVRRYEHRAPEDLIHVDIKKFGRIPDGGGHRIHGRAQGSRNSSAHREPARPRKVQGRPNLGYAYLHHAVDDHSRYAYSEILGDEKKDTATAFMARALAHFTSIGVSTTRVMTDNGSCYRYTMFRNLLANNGIKYKWTRLYRPQTNGKVEQFNRTLQEEWAYAHPYLSESERIAAFPEFLRIYNHERGHTALRGNSPASRVPNLASQSSRAATSTSTRVRSSSSRSSVKFSRSTPPQVPGDGVGQVSNHRNAISRLTAKGSISCGATVCDVFAAVMISPRRRL